MTISSKPCFSVPLRHLAARCRAVGTRPTLIGMLLLIVATGCSQKPNEASTTNTTPVAASTAIAPSFPGTPSTASDTPVSPVKDGPAAAKPETPEVQITLTAVVDGSDHFIFTKEAASLIHLYAQPPKKVTLSDEPWTKLGSSPEHWATLAAGLDLRKAHIVKRHGRDVIALEHTEEGFDIYFADCQNGGDLYEVTISVPLL